MQLRAIKFYNIIFCLLLLCQAANGADHVQARLWGRLGNHLFIIAATTSYALDHGMTPHFPDLTGDKTFPEFLQGNYHLPSLKTNYDKLFRHLNVSKPPVPIECTYREPHFTYDPIPYRPNMLLEGWFQSEKYFINHKQEILDLFAPPMAIRNYLEEKYAQFIDHPYTVAVHLRCYHKENPNLDSIYPTYGRKYFEKAMALFDENALFLVFSDQIGWAKKELAGIPRNVQFIEGEEYYHDFYLMSMCKHHIISNSTFSWWAAYLNRNPNKMVVVPPRWFVREYGHDSSDLIPPEWIILKEVE